MAKVKLTQNNLDNIIDKNVNKFLDGTGKTQKDIYDQLLLLLKNLKTNSNGAIKQTVANLKAAYKIRQIVESIVLNPEYKKKVGEFLGGYDAVKEINDKYLKTIEKAFDPTKEIYEVTKQIAIFRMRDSLTEAGINANIIEPLHDIIDKSITGGAFFSDMVKELEGFILDDEENLGHLKRYASQITWDGMEQFNRAYVLSFAKDTKKEWWRYSSGLVRDSRTYCRQRQGRYFHTKEIEDSADISLSAWGGGKIPGTNRSSIFNYCGGYNCKHHYTPVLIDIVPKAVIERNIKNGNYKP